MRTTVFLIIVSIIAFSACEKEPGPGGTATITGKVYEKEYNYNYTELIGEHYAQEEDVYIIYGEDSVYSDKFETSYDGSYRFEYLQKGTYTIFVYSKDTTDFFPNGKAVEKRVVEITENNQTITLDDIIIYDN